MLTIEKVHAEKTHAHENKLISESSPYLLQHAHNPVHWYPWGDEAFAKAKSENKPILLSIGYSTCHWCHVMEHESFEDVEIANMMNQHYVAIKVDREQRPDIDSIYMSVVQGITGRGGWPMTVWLTPEREPYYGGTYFPPRDGARPGHPGFLELLQKLAELYRDHPKEILERAKQITEQISKHIEHEQNGNLPSTEVFQVAYQQLAQNYDARYGGFGFAPKFPRPSTLQFLLRYFARTNESKALEMVQGTLLGMLQGGIYDQIGGGFARYSVDAYWLVPHFEKMLYDQSQIVLTLLDTYQISKHAEFGRVANETLQYVQKEMTNPEGGFYSATDADSEGEEGKFFVWSIDEIAKNVGEDLAELFCEYYGVTAHGNFESHNILHIKETIESFAKKKNLNAEKLKKDFDVARQKLYDVRSKRIPPLTDDKTITAWNGLMIAAFARASIVFGDEGYLRSAIHASDYILLKLVKDGELHRSIRKERVTAKAFLDDYACFIFGLLELFQATGDTKWFMEAKKLQDQMIQKFWDSASGGFYSTSTKEFFAREKPFYDGAEPSGNSIAAENLLRFATLLKDDDYKTYARKIFESFGTIIDQNPTYLPQMLVSLDYYHSNVKELVLVDAGDEKFEDLLHVVRDQYLPHRVILNLRKGQPGLEPFPSLAEKVGVKVSTAYVCEGFVCQAPATDPKMFQKQIKSS